MTPDDAAAAAQAAATSSGGASAGSSELSQLPAQVQQQIGEAVANDFAVATQAVLIGMAIVLVVSFLVSLAHPGGRVTQERVEGPPATAPEAA